METARRPTFAPDRASGRHLWTDDAHDLVLLDVMLPDGNGIELLAERRAAGDLTPTVLLTTYEDAELRNRAASAGATAYLTKPFAFQAPSGSGSSRGAPIGGCPSPGARCSGSPGVSMGVGLESSSGIGGGVSSLGGC